MKKLKVFFYCSACALYFFSASSRATPPDKHYVVVTQNGSKNVWYADDTSSEKAMVYATSAYPEIKAINYKHKTSNDIDHWVFKIADVELTPEDLGTPSQVDGSAPIATTHLKNKDISAYCISVIRNLSGYSQHFHNNFVVYKINNVWQALNFSTPLTCKNSVSLSNKGLKIKYQVADNTDEWKPGYVTQRLLLIDKNGERADSLLSKKYWKKIYQAFTS
jgi:hypothetical protein